jgi:tetratricopeptide (TPR) repeat protein
MMFFKKKKFPISDNDKNWVQESFRWLIEVYGYPTGKTKTIFFTNDFFPHTFSQKKINIDFLINDFSNLFNIDRGRISFIIDEDIRDTIDTPYQIDGHIENTELFVDRSTGKNLYKIVIAKSLLLNTGQLLLNIDINFIKIRLTESKIEYETDEDNEHFVYLAGIFSGHGLILYRNLIDSGTSSDNFWQKKWRYISIMPEPVMTYALALYCNLFDEDDPAWKSILSADLKNKFENAVEFVKADGNPLFNKQELNANNSYNQAVSYYERNDFNNAIVEFQKALFATTDSYLKADIYNFIGYSYLRMQEYQKSILQFQKALEIRPGYGYANDNLGFAFIMSGDLDSGKFYLNTALKTENNDAGYSYRNFALYHQKRQEYEQAEEYFQKAFNNILIPIDFLEYFYAQFLFEVGKKEDGMSFLKIAIEKGEPEAIKLMNSLNQS